MKKSELKNLIRECANELMLENQMQTSAEMMAQGMVGPLMMTGMSEEQAEKEALKQAKEILAKILHGPR